MHYATSERLSVIVEREFFFHDANGKVIFCVNCVDFCVVFSVSYRCNPQTDILLCVCVRCLYLRMNGFRDDCLV